MRVGLTSTPSIVTSEPGTSSAAAATKAAELGSPGTVDSRPCKLRIALDRDARAAASLQCDRTSAPK